MRFQIIAQVMPKIRVTTVVFTPTAHTVRHQKKERDPKYYVDLTSDRKSLVAGGVSN
jgi:hypothetical protein